MCLTAKPTVEWTVSTVQVVPAGIGGEVAMAVIASVSFWLGIRTVVRLLSDTVARETDRGPVMLS